MPSNLSKEEVANLSEEQLRTYAKAHLDSQRARRELCDIVRGHNRSLILPILIGTIAIVALIWFPSVLVYLVIALPFALHWTTNRRIDALVRLLDIDRMEENESAD